MPARASATRCRCGGGAQLLSSPRTEGLTMACPASGKLWPALATLMPSTGAIHARAAVTCARPAGLLRLVSVGGRRVWHHVP
jgi:hypothetical protein